MAWYERDYNRAPSGFGGFSGFGQGGSRSGTSITIWLLAINGIVFILTGVLHGSSRAGGLSPYEWGNFNIHDCFGRFQLWRLVTYQFLHSGFGHILFNLIALYFFGPMIESWWGRRRYLAFYLASGVGGAIVYSVIAVAVPSVLKVGPDTQLVGASAGITAILVGCAILYPNQRVMLMLPPIPMKMRTLALCLIGLNVLAVAAGSPNAGGFAAHLGGAAFGFALIKYPHLLRFAEGGGTAGGLKRMTGRRQKNKLERGRQQEHKEEEAVDHILDKVRQKGIHSLTSKEKKMLKRATQRQRRAG